MTLLGSQGWDPRKEFGAKKYLYGEGIRMEAPQTQSGRLQGTANVSYRKASIDVTSLKESAGAPRNLLLVHSFYQCHSEVRWTTKGPPLSAWRKALPTHCPQAQSASVSPSVPQIPHILNGHAYCLCPGVGKVGCESPRTCLLGSQLTRPKVTL